MPARSPGRAGARPPSAAAPLVALLAAGLAAPGSARATPFSPASLDAQVQQAAAAIEPDSLQSYLVALQGFTTRHSASDTTSSVTGIGAARRWVHAKLAEFAAGGGNVIPSYHDFTTTISGTSRLHRNVVGEIPGTVQGAGKRIYVIGAHLDSRNEDVNDAVGPAWGVDDDASGVACLLELARVMSAHSWPMTLRFVAFVGEEQGLIGSWFYARRVIDLAEPVAAMLNNDTMASIVGAPHPDSTATTDTTLARVFAAGPESGVHRQLQRYLAAMGDAYVPIQDIVVIPAEDRPGRGGDHESFSDAGIPAIRYMEYLEETDRQHTACCDTLGPHLSMSYLRRNAQVDLATLGNLTLSPATPAGLAVGDVGDSTGFRLTWPASPDPAVTGYLITVRRPGELDWSQVLDVGLVTETVFASAASESVWFSLSARDALDRRALPGSEALGVLSSVPRAPLGLAAVPESARIRLTWTANAEADLAGYRVHRSETPGSGYVPLTPSPVPLPAWDDAGAAAHTRYWYVVTAVDLDGRESPFSNEVSARLLTLDSGILFVDETKNGGTAWFPPDALADSVYAAMLVNLPHDVWDVDAQGIPTLSDLGIYSSVLWAADDFNTSFDGFPVVTQRLRDAVAPLSAYLDAGGNLLVAGWHGAEGVHYPAGYPVDPAPGDFLHDYFGIDAIQLKVQRSWTGGTGQAFFGNLTPEPTRLNPQWMSKLVRVEWTSALVAGTEVAYRYGSADPDSAYHDQPCGFFRDGGTWRTVYLGFPLYHLETTGARAMLEAAATWFGELPSTGVAAGVAGTALALGPPRPNPARGETTFPLVLPGGAKATLAVFDVAGRRVRTLLAGRPPAGSQEITWDGRNDAGRRVAGGIYFLRLVAEVPGAGTRTLTRKITQLR